MHLMTLRRFFSFCDVTRVLTLIDRSDGGTRSGHAGLCLHPGVRWVGRILQEVPCRRIRGWIKFSRKSNVQQRIGTITRQVLHMTSRIF